MIDTLKVVAQQMRKAAGDAADVAGQRNLQIVAVAAAIEDRCSLPAFKSLQFAERLLTEYWANVETKAGKSLAPAVYAKAIGAGTPHLTEQIVSLVQRAQANARQKRAENKLGVHRSNV